MNKILLFFLFGILSTKGLCATPDVKVKILWEYTNLPHAMKIYEVDPKKKTRLWEMGSVKVLTEAPVTSEIVESTLLMKPGQKKRFVLIFTNPDPKPYYFFAAPHHAVPAEHSLGFKFKCLCTNHAYTAGPHEIWFRVVEFNLSKDFEGTELSLSHNVIGITKERMNNFSKASEMPDG